MVLTTTIAAIPWSNYDLIWDLVAFNRATNRRHEVIVLPSEFGPGRMSARNPYLPSTLGNQVGDKLTTGGVTTREVSCTSYSQVKFGRPEAR